MKYNELKKKIGQNKFHSNIKFFHWNFKPPLKLSLTHFISYNFYPFNLLFNINLQPFFSMSIFIFPCYYWFPVFAIERRGWGGVMSSRLAYELHTKSQPTCHHDFEANFLASMKDIINVQNIQQHQSPVRQNFTAVTQKAAELADTRHRTKAFPQTERGVAQRDGRLKTPPSNSNQNLLVPRHLQ